MSRKTGRKRRDVSKYLISSEVAADLLRKKYRMGGPRIRLEFARLRPILNYKLHEWSGYPYTIGHSLYKMHSSERYNPELLVTDEPGSSLVTEKKAYKNEVMEATPLSLKHAEPLEVHEEDGQIEKEMKTEWVEGLDDIEIGELGSHEDDFDVEQLMEEIKSMFENRFELETVQRNGTIEKREESLKPNFDLLEDLETSDDLLEVEDKEDEEG